MKEGIRWPNNKQRLTIMGRTGSGKTVAGVFHLSRQNFTQQPWYVIDFKRDKLINDIERAVHVEAGDKLQKKPGIYVVHSMPEDVNDKIPALFRRIWEKEKVGVFVDEGFMLGKTGDMPEYEALLTQGRSKRIPMIINTQRPVWLSRFAISEADFFQFFQMNDRKDRDTVRSFFPGTVDLERALPDYHSHYYDVGRNLAFKLAPVPAESELLDTIDERLKIKIARL